MVVDQDGLNAPNLWVSTLLEMISRCEFDTGSLTSIGVIGFAIAPPDSSTTAFTVDRDQRQTLHQKKWRTRQDLLVRAVLAQLT